MLRRFHILASLFGLPAVLLSAPTLGQEEEAEQRSFDVATADHLLDAVRTCEASKSGQLFDTDKVRERGWRQLSNRNAVPQDHTMFGKESSGASVTVTRSADGPDRACLVIGWVDSEATAENAKDRIAGELGLAFQVDGPAKATAEADGWSYTYLRLSKPEVTDQTRVIFLIAPAQESSDPEGN